jgi:hypothetical protein
MVPGSVARNKGRRSSAEQVAAERDKARRTREDAQSIELWERYTDEFVASPQAVAESFTE